jgi:hypothetical protein
VRGSALVLQRKRVQGSNHARRNGYTLLST